MKQIKISSFPNKDIKNFKNLKDNREKIINRTESKNVNGEYIVDKLAKSIHPSYQKLLIKNIIEVNSNTKIFYFCNALGDKLATFRPGQYITLMFQFDDKFVSRPYSLSSSPNDALNNVYRINVTRVKNGIVSNYMLDNLDIGDVIDSLSPSGNFYPSIIRDKKQLVGIARGYGISPLVSIAKSIEDKSLDKDLTIFYEANGENEFIYKDELNRLDNTSNNIKVIFINRNNAKNRITVNMIKSFVTAKFTVFACGDIDFYNEIKKELSVLNLGRKDLRLECSHSIDENKNHIKEENTNSKARKEFNIKVFSNNEEYNVTCAEDQTILSALELSNVRVRSKCRSGECGYCRSLLLWGNVRIKEGVEHRRAADIKFNYIHPCCTYPTSDITIKIDN